MFSRVYSFTYQAGFKKEGNLRSSLKRNKAKKYTVNSTPKQEIALTQECDTTQALQLNSDTSDWDTTNISAVERFQHATSLQVLYEDMETYQNEIKNYKDWMIILERLEAMQSFDPHLFNECITEQWFKIGKPLVETMSDEEIYCVIEKLARLQLCLQQNYTTEFFLERGYQHLIHGKFSRDLLEKLGMGDFTSWCNVFDRVTQINGVDQNFIKELVLKHFLPLAEKFISEGNLHQIHQLLLRISGLQLSISEVNTISFVRKLCRLQVLRYQSKQAVHLNMYIDMLSIVGEMIPDRSLYEIKDKRYEYWYSVGYKDTGPHLDEEIQKDIIPFFKICYSVVLLNIKDITSLEQIQQIQKVRIKFDERYGIPNEVRQWSYQVRNLKIPSVTDQELKDALSQYEN